MSPQTFIFIGRSGCGKGTQADLLQKVVKEKDPQGEIFYLETGANFREFVQGSNYSRKLSDDLMRKGDRQPDFLAIWMWSESLLDNFKGTEHLFLDGITRSLPEAMAFSTALNFYNRTATVISIEVSRGWASDRMVSRKRSDDASMEEINKKLDWFDSDSLPALDYFKHDSRYAVVSVNGEQEIAKVHADILSGLTL